MDGPSPEPIKEVNKISDREFQVLIQNPFNKQTKELNIYILDLDVMLALWEFSSEPNDYRYKIYIPKESADLFDIVVNYCKTQKQLEYRFDTIDHEKIKATNSQYK